jgi:hypothetical protein
MSDDRVMGYLWGLLGGAGALALFLVPNWLSVFLIAASIVGCWYGSRT